MLHSVLLSPLDQFMPSRHVRVILAFSHSDPKAAVASLDAGLRVTCTQIPYLKGSVYQSDQQGYLGVAWSDGYPPVQLHEGPALHDMPTFAELDAQGMLDRYMSASLFSPVTEETTGSGSKIPVLRLNYAITRGGFILCIYFHHNVMDAAGAADLLNVWASNTRSDSTATATKILDDMTGRSALLKEALFSNPVTASGPNQAAQTKSQAAARPGVGSSAPSMADTASTVARTASPPVISSLFTCEASKLDNLSNALAPATSGQHISKNAVITALVWSRVSLIRSQRRQRECSQTPNNALPSTINSSIVMTVNLRKYVFGQSGPKDLFLGNLLTTLPTPLSVTDSTLSDLTTDDTSKIRYPSILPHVASAITASHSSISSQRASGMYSLAANMPDVRAFRRARAPFNGNDLIVTSWMNFPFYPDFGPDIGVPADVRLPDVGEDADGLLVVLPRRRVGGRDGEIDIMVALREDDMEELQRDDLFNQLTRMLTPT